MNVDVYLLDWNDRRPWVTGPPNSEVLVAARAGRYEYSFSLDASVPKYADRTSTAIACGEYAWAHQQDDRKVRRDRQSMSMGDAVIVDGTAWVAASIGFVEVPGLEQLLALRIEQSWCRWTGSEVAP